MRPNARGEAAETAADGGRPFPPGDYPVVVVGSGPGGIQVSYSLARLGIPHATISADEAPGGMFRRWPFFQRLLSWTKPFAPEPRGSAPYERYDWNSLLAVEPEHRALQPSFMDGTSYFPSRPEMERNLAAFAERTGTTVRYGTRWLTTRREDGPDGVRFVLGTSDGDYRSPVVVFAVGVAEPWSPSTPGMELARHYAETRAAESYADRRVFIVGKQNSGFELASGLLQWARRIVIASPSPTKLSVDTNSLVGVRARYVQPYEDHVLGGGVSILDASIDAIERGETGGELVVRMRQTASGSPLAVPADDVISATGFVAPLLDLPDLGVATFGHSRVPAQTAWWESATVPGIYFAGTISQGAQGLRKHGIPSNSGAVHGARYNARILAREIGRRHFGQAGHGRSIAAGDVIGLLIDEIAHGPELWHQRGYLVRVVSFDADAGVRDEGTIPLAAFLDEPGSDAVGMTLESDGTGAIYPVAYVRHAGRTTEHDFDPDPLLDFGAPRYRSEIESIVRDVAPELAPAS
ncbi:MAG TPA: NAD(P)-binding domain-containing protein [Candidatus Limnocylindrales bacterium]|nr:NAD(P)-binding domain-containing protein [Candidatus Limnocylindrales bacterium]